MHFTRSLNGRSTVSKSFLMIQNLILNSKTTLCNPGAMEEKSGEKSGEESRRSEKIPKMLAQESCILTTAIWRLDASAEGASGEIFVVFDVLRYRNRS